MSEKPILLHWSITQIFVIILKARDMYELIQYSMSWLLWRFDPLSVDSMRVLPLAWIDSQLLILPCDLFGEKAQDIVS